MGPARVLVLSDDQVMGDLVVLNLQRRGYLAQRVTEAGLYADGCEGELLGKADAIIVDGLGPDAEVWRLAGLLRKRPSVRKTPLLLLIASWPDQRRSLALAPCAWLHKPCSMVSLLTQLERSLAIAGPGGRELPEAAISDC